MTKHYGIILDSAVATVTRVVVDAEGGMTLQTLRVQEQIALTPAQATGLIAVLEEHREHGIPSDPVLVKLMADTTNGHLGC